LFKIERDMIMGIDNNKYRVSALKISVEDAEKELILKDLAKVLDSDISWTNSHYVSRVESLLSQ